MKKLVILLFLLSVVVGVNAQDVTLEVTQRPFVYNSFSPANFDPDHPELQPVLFRLKVISNIEDNYFLVCTMSYPDYPSAIINLDPKPNLTYPIFLSNQDIVVRDEHPGNFTVEGDYEAFIDAMEEDIMETGKIPDGIYTFTIEAKDSENNELIDTAIIEMVIESPITISLVTPGTPLGRTPAVISTQYPQFVWFSNLENYTFKLYELDAIMNSSEEIERQYEPILATENLSSTSFTYPSSAPGFNTRNVYAWIISAETLSPSGSTVEKSIMYHFTFSQQGQTSMENQQVINFLNQLGNDQFNQMVTLLESGYSFAGLTWEGETAGVEKLNEIVQKILNGELQIEEITWE